MSNPYFDLKPVVEIHLLRVQLDITSGIAAVHAFVAA